MIETDSETRVTKMTRRLQNNPILSVIVVIGIIVIAVASFTEAIDRIRKFIIPQSQPPPAAQVPSITVPLSEVLLEIEKAKHVVAERAITDPNQKKSRIWRRLDSDSQSGFY